MVSVREGVGGRGKGERKGEREREGEGGGKGEKEGNERGRRKGGKEGGRERKREWWEGVEDTPYRSVHKQERLLIPNFEIGKPC